MEQSRARPAVVPQQPLRPRPRPPSRSVGEARGDYARLESEVPPHISNENLTFTFPGLSLLTISATLHPWLGTRSGYPLALRPRWPDPR